MGIYYVIFVDAFGISYKIIQYLPGESLKLSNDPNLKSWWPTICNGFVWVQRSSVTADF